MNQEGKGKESGDKSTRDERTERISRRDIMGKIIKKALFSRKFPDISIIWKVEVDRTIRGGKMG